MNFKVTLRDTNRAAFAIMFRVMNARGLPQTGEREEVRSENKCEENTYRWRGRQAMVNSLFINIGKI